MSTKGLYIRLKTPGLGGFGSVMLSAALFYCIALATQSAIAAEFVTIEEENGEWFFTKGGSRDFSFGVNYIDIAQYWPSGTTEYDERKALGYYSVQQDYTPPFHDWAQETANRLNGWGLNTLGPWSREVLYEQPMLHTRLLSTGNTWGTNELVDVWGSQFLDHLDDAIRDVCTANRENEWLVGYFVGNELPWYGRYGWPTIEDSLLAEYNKLPAAAPGKVVLVSFLKEKFPEFQTLRQHFATTAGSWAEFEAGTPVRGWSYQAKAIETEWAGVVAERYFRVCSEAVRGYDPNHLILGSRFPSNAPLEVWLAAARYCDVLSANYYTPSAETAIDRWRSVHAVTGKPLMVTEHSWRATDNRSGNPNTVGANCTVATQQERGDRLLAFATAWMNEPYFVGLHWFQYFDQPPGGRPGVNGENSNYGLVDIDDRPYTEVTNAWQTVAQNFPGTRPAPTSVPDSVDLQEFNIPRIASTPSPTIDVPKLAWNPNRSGTFYVTLDSANGASYGQDADSSCLDLLVDSGNGWGATLVLQSPNLSEGLGAGMIEFDLTVGAEVEYRIALTETTTAGTPADGERYETPEIRGTGVPQTLRIPFDNFAISPFQGNQNGNQELALGHLSNILLLFRGKQNEFPVHVGTLRWLPLNDRFQPSVVDTGILKN